MSVSGEENTEQRTDEVSTTFLLDEAAFLACVCISLCSPDRKHSSCFPLPSGSATEAVLYSLHSVTVAGQSEFRNFFFFKEFSLLPSLAVQHSSLCWTHGGSVCQRSSSWGESWGYWVHSEEREKTDKTERHTSQMANSASNWLLKMLILKVPGGRDHTTSDLFWHHLGVM